MSPADFFRSPFFRGNTWVRVKPSTAVEIPPHSIVLITGSIISNGGLVFTVAQPNNGSSAFKWGGYLVTGPRLIGGDTAYEGIATTANSPTLARVNGSPAVNQVWGPAPSQYTLERYYYGFMTLGSSTTSGGNTVAPVVWAGIPSIVGKVDDSSVSDGGTCTVSVQVGSSYQTDSNMDVSGVYNRGGGSLTSTTNLYCKVSAPNGVPVLDWVHC